MMTQTRKNASPDWLIQGVLTRIGDILDRLTGRRWKPSSSLATSQLIERLKLLMDAEAVTDEKSRKFIPHNITLKMQWDKFAADSETALKTIENEFLIAAVDHINDRHYYTREPLFVEVKPDYFTEGVKLSVSFDKNADDEDERGINVSVPGTKTDVNELPELAPVNIASAELLVRFELNGQLKERKLELSAGKRISVGRTKENDLALDDISVSKFHASLVFNENGKLVVADTGSTNGTFVGGERIAYGKAVEVTTDSDLKFGSLGVKLTLTLPPAPPQPTAEPTVEYSNSQVIDGFEFRKKEPEQNGPTQAATMEMSVPAPAPTLTALTEDIVIKEEDKTTA
ncbi:MAG: FHA domain-containing protein [Acidobacteria bacterium]|nr:FHA domain-containing protein [Acidobacteriota bacterium]